jgi:hypothetical protein
MQTKCKTTTFINYHGAIRMNTRKRINRVTTVTRCLTAHYFTITAATKKSEDQGV